MLGELWTSIRLAAVSIILCCGIYVPLVLLAAMVIAPESRHGSLVTANGQLVGSRLIAQNFSRPEYLWPRPSAVNYAADAAGGSNLSPTNPAIAVRAGEILGRLGATQEHLAPAELVLASGSGLDPNLTLEAALYQADRIAGARNTDVSKVRSLIDELAGQPRPGEEDLNQLVNVLEVNLALDRAFPTAPDGR